MTAEFYRGCIEELLGLGDRRSRHSRFHYSAKAASLGRVHSIHLARIDYLGGESLLVELLLVFQVLDDGLTLTRCMVPIVHLRRLHNFLIESDNRVALGYTYSMSPTTKQQFISELLVVLTPDASPSCYVVRLKGIERFRRDGRARVPITELLGMVLMLL